MLSNSGGNSKGACRAKRGRIAGCLVAALLLPMLMAWPAHAQGGTSAVCRIVSPIHFSPGLTLSPRSGTYGSGGETGSITCEGTIYGHSVTGPGSFGFEGHYRAGDCLSHNGSGTSFFTVPTDAGPVHVAGGTFRESRIGLNGAARASHAGGIHFVGTYVVVPTQGNCITTVLTDGRAHLAGSLRG